MYSPNKKVGSCQGGVTSGGYINSGSLPLIGENMKKLAFLTTMVFAVALLAAGASAVTDCSFTDTGSEWLLDGDCTTDETLFVPDGYTLDGQGNTITAVEGVSSVFNGAVVSNDGDEMHVTNVVITTDGLDTCAGGDDRLRGILFNEAAGSVTDSTVDNVNRGLSGCQEGNAIEARNAPFDGTGVDPLEVHVKDNIVSDYQKGGIICNGNLDCTIENNDVSNSFADQDYIAANSVQVAYGARATVQRNNIEGNSWCGGSAYVATAMLLFYQADGTVVSQNNIRGDSDVAIYAFGGATTIDNNKVFEDKFAANCNVLYPDSYGIGAWGGSDTVTNNKVKGFATPYSGDGFEGGKNKVIPGPNGPNAESPDVNPIW